VQIAILGAGAWGTALACALAPRHATLLWARSGTQAAQMARVRRNEKYLPAHAFPESLQVSADLAGAVRHATGGLVFLACPTESLRELLRGLRAQGYAGSCSWLCKGLERESGMLAHEIAAVELPGIDAGPLTGPSFADEVARGMPTALVVAGTPALCEKVTHAVHGGKLRVYTSDDVIGAEVGGAVKNVLAIATGIGDALELGLNARAALITRGLAETRRLGEALGAHGETFTGLTGLGDLILTCTGDLSRNRQVGIALGQGVALDQAIAQLGHVAEGVWSAPAIMSRARKLGVEMPICEGVCSVLEGRSAPRAAVERLLSRDPRAERGR
jgi:glycerol-3-phosphate dehydrogenase (NAD(P)+)